MSATWRCFVAIPVSEKLRRDLAAAVDEWRPRPDLAGLRWTDPDGWHLTLAFLGAADPGTVPKLAARLASVAGAAEPMELEGGGLGGFPTPARAQVAWYRLDEPAGHLARLAAAVRIATGGEGHAPFRPHVTLARSRDRRGSVDLRGWLAEAAAPAGRLVVDRIDLLRSHLGPGPARYELLATSTIGAPVRG